MTSPSKIKVALVQPKIPIYRVALLSYLSQFKDIEFTCFHSRGNRHGAISAGTNLPVTNELVPAVYLPSRGGPIYQCAISRIIRGRFDIVICCQDISNITSLILWLLHKVFKYKFLWWGIGFDPFRQNTPNSKPDGLINKIIVCLKETLWKRSDALLVYTNESKDYSIRKKIYPDKIFVLNNTLDVEQLWREAKTIRQEDIQKTREQLGLLENSFVFLFLGRLYNRKEIPVLLKAYAKITDDLKNSKLVIIGDGQDREKIQNLIDSLGIEEQVIMLGAIYDSRRLGELLLISDVVTLPGQVGLSVVHSFAYGKPVITRASDTYSSELEYVIDGVNGIRLKDKQIQSYADMMREVCFNAELLKKLSEGACKTAEKLTMRKMADNFRDAIIYVVNAKIQKEKGCYTIP